MRIIYHDGRLFAIAAFGFCITTTLAILLGDVLTGVVPFALKHWMAVAVLMCTILFGHIGKKAGWLDPKKYGFWLLFWLGTALVAYSSIGRQAETMTISATQAEQDGERRREAKAEIASNAAMLRAAQVELARECKTGAGKRCAGIERTIAVYTAAIAGNQAILEKLGPAKPVAPNADKTAEVLALFGYDAKHVKAMAVLLEPIGYFAFLEYGSILTLGFVLGSRKTGKGPRPVSAQPQSVPLVTTSPEVVAPPVAQRPVLVKDTAQSSFPMAANVQSHNGMVRLFREPDRWCYSAELS